jgi:MFS family permease
MTPVTEARRRAPRPRVPRAGLLARRDFRLLWTGETTSSFGTAIGEVSLQLVALTVLHASVLWISALTAVAWLPWVVIGLPAGAWVDRLRRRRVMIAADFVSLAAFASVPLAAALGILGIRQLLVVAALAGTAAVFFTAAYRAFLPTLVGAADLLEGNAKMQGSQQAGNVAGPGAAGLIAQAASPVLGVLADAISFAVSAACLLRIRVPEPPPPAARLPLRQAIGEGLAVVAREPLLRWNTVAGCLTNFVLTGYGSVSVVYLVSVVGLRPAAAGLILALASLGGVLGAVSARALAAQIGTGRAVLLARLALVPSGLLIPLADRGPGLVLFVLGATTLSCGAIAGNIIWSGFVQSYYPREMLGRVSTSVQFFNYGMIPAGALVAGVLASHLGVRRALWSLVAGLLISAGTLLLGPLRAHRDLPVRVADRS